MILHCSIPKARPHSNTLQLNLIKNKQLKAMTPPPGLEKLKNNMPGLIAFTEDINKAAMKIDKL